MTGNKVDETKCDCEKEIKELNARMEVLVMQNESLKNLLKQVHDIFSRQEELSNAIRGNLSIGKDILVGIAFKELNDMIVSNRKVLDQVVKELK